MTAFLLRAVLIAALLGGMVSTVIGSRNGTLLSGGDSLCLHRPVVKGGGS